ncbi:MAG TPA: DUF6600 domain-containing protein [Myxococcales bacterium]|jgi:hypothetical protein
MLRNLIVLTVLLGAVPSAHAGVEFEASVNFETFDQPLAAHGEWVVVGNYGRVWRPFHAAADWRPYLDGQWVWTDEGWLWDSAEPWAWATYHYGRWSWEPGWGWIWVPGYEWAPAWVEWRYSAGCVGWAPLFPLGIALVHQPVYYDYWTFVPSHSFVGVPVRSVFWSHERVREHWNRTTPAPGWHGGRHHGRDQNGQGSPTYGAPNVHQAEPAFGPPRSFIEREVGRPIQAVRPVQVSSPAEIGRHRGAPVVFRPSRAERPAPAMSNPAATAQPERRGPATYPTPPERREVRPAAQPQPAPAFNRPAPVRPEPRPMVTRPEPVRPEPRPMVTRPEPVRPAYNRPESSPAMTRPEPRPAYRPQEISRPAPQRAAPQTARPEYRPQRPQQQPAMRAPVAAPQPQRPAVPQAQPNRPAGNDRRRR